MAFLTNYVGYRPRQYCETFTNICDTCGADIPRDRFRATTCDDTCDRAKRAKRTRTEQFWRDYSEGKITLEGDENGTTTTPKKKRAA